MATDDDTHDATAALFDEIRKTYRRIGAPDSYANEVINNLRRALDIGPVAVNRERGGDFDAAEVAQ